jgi:hypothetical protein
VKTYEPVGDVDVDSGMIWIGDPCYIKDKLLDWRKVCTKIEEEQDRGITRFRHAAGNEGMGVCIGGFGGDGSYIVEVVRSKTGLIKEARIVFSTDE